MKKKIKLFLLKYNILIYVYNIIIFFRKNNKNNDNMNKFLFFFLNLCKKQNIYLFPFFGTLLGLYRDGGVINYDNDIDFALIKNQNTYKILKFLSDNNFTKILDCTIVETNQLTLEKYKNKDFEIDIFYLYEENDYFYFFDNESNSGLSTIEEINNNIIVNPYLNKISKFEIKTLFLNNLFFLAPSNPKLLLTELYGDKFMIPDKFWRQSKRKNRIKTDFTICINEY